MVPATGLAGRHHGRIQHATPRRATPRHAAPRRATPRHATLQSTSPRHTTPHPTTTPHHATHHTTLRRTLPCIVWQRCGATPHYTLHATAALCTRQRALTSSTIDSALAASAARSPPTAEEPPMGLPTAAASIDECVVCLAAPRECVLVSCGHACVCEACSGALALCPLCREPIERAIRIFT